MARRDHPLYRDTDDKMIGGVCSGLAQYFDVDTILLRVGFVVFTALGGGGVLAYLILWLVLDPAPAAEPAPRLEPPTPADDSVLNGAAAQPAAVDRPAGDDPLTVDEPPVVVERADDAEPPAEATTESQPSTER